jgi:hypothetical protein
MSNVGEAAHHKRVKENIEEVAERLTKGDDVPGDNLVLEESIAIADRHDYDYDVVCEKLDATVQRIIRRKRAAGVYG